MNKKSALKAVASLLSLVMLISCASIMGKGGPETLALRSTPDQATVVITDEGGAKVFEGKTPTTVSLEKKKGYFSGKKYTVKISKLGFAEQSVTVDTKANGWYIGGNLLLGGLIGWFIVDPATGAMWTLDTNELNVSLDASQKANLTEPHVNVVLLEDVPISLRSQMVKVSQ